MNGGWGAESPVKVQAHESTPTEVMARFLPEPKQSRAIKGKLFEKMEEAIQPQALAAISLLLNRQ